MAGMAARLLGRPSLLTRRQMVPMFKSQRPDRGVVQKYCCYSFWPLEVVVLPPLLLLLLLKLHGTHGAHAWEPEARQRLSLGLFDHIGHPHAVTFVFSSGQYRQPQHDIEKKIHQPIHWTQCPSHLFCTPNKDREIPSLIMKGKRYLQLTCHGPIPVSRHMPLVLQTRRCCHCKENE